MELPSFRRRRLTVFALGVGSLAALLAVNPSLPDPFAYLLVGVPLALCYYGFTTHPARTVVFRLGLVVVGLEVGDALTDAGVV
jgi:hypothetical protein